MTRVASELDADTALQAMKQATQQLDEILQDMCAGKNPPSGAAANEEEEFADARESDLANQEGGNSSCAGVNDAHEGEKMLLQYVEYQSLEDYFKAVEAALAGSVDLGSAIRLLNQPLCVGAGGDLDQLLPTSASRKLQYELFANLTRSMVFHFAHDSKLNHWLSSGNSSNGECSASPPVSELEANVSFELFVARLRQQVRERDHLLPASKIDGIVHKVLSGLATQNTTTVNAIRTFFGESGIKVNNQACDLHWQQGNSQVTQICVRETECDFQWGLQVSVTTSSLFRAQITQSDGSHLEGPVVSTMSQHSVFLPKSKYNDSEEDESTPSSISSTTNVYLMGQKGTTSSSRESNEIQAGDGAENASSEPNSSVSSPESFASYSTDQPKRELPELLKVYVRGGFSDEMANDATPISQQSNEFVKLSIQTPFPRMRIIQAACSRFHALLLNDLGMVFAFGHSVDGALGLGFDEGMGGVVTSPKLLTFFFDKLITVKDVACGGDPMAGAHSAAVTTDGKVYTWGTGVALGNRSVRSHSEPQLIEFPPVDELSVSDQPQNENQDNQQSDAGAVKIQSISCGGGFCIALVETGHAFAWGKWSDGRLGLGKIPVLNQSSRKYGRRRQFQSFQLTPKQLASPWTGVNNASVATIALLFTKISCGEAHCIGLTRDGAILTWGRGTHGQLGHGTTKDALGPIGIVIASERHLKWRDVTAGENWSMALDVHGRVWTWGACGGEVLGHGNGTSSRKTAVVTEMILQRHHRLLKQQQRQPVATNNLEMVALSPLPQLNWMRPQLVPSFSNSGGVQIHKLSAGLQHAAAVSQDGDLYLWGEGNGFSGLPNLVRSASIGDKKSIENAMGSEIVEDVACGGNLAIVFTSGSFLARSMQQLHHQCALLSAEHQDLDRSAYNQAISRLATDIVLLVSGKRLFAHKLLLARRSEVLRDLILNEQRTNFTSPQQTQQQGRDGNAEQQQEFSLMELLLPQLRFDVAQVLLEFIYTDNFSLMLNPQSYLIRDVLRAAKFYKLQSLEKLCRDALAGGAASSVYPLDGFDVGSSLHPGVNTGKNASDQELRSLNVDLQFAFGDSTWSDLTLLTEGNREIPVHRCMLIARSEYFRALLGFQLKHGQQQEHESKANMVIEVNESYVSMLRVLNFIYNDHVALPSALEENNQQQNGNDDDGEDDDATERLLEDLIAADKYGLARWKRLCEHALRVNLANCLEVLAVADLVSASHLKQVALAFLQSNLPIVTSEPAFVKFKSDFPHLLEELFASIRMETTNETLLRVSTVPICCTELLAYPNSSLHHNWHNAVETQLNLQREQEARDWKAKSEAAAKFPWLYLILAITFATLYLAVMSKQAHEYPFVPALNLVALLGFFCALFFGWI